MTTAQRRTVLMACEGLNDDEIAEQLGLSAVSVRMIFDAAAKRLHTTNRTATVYHAIMLGEIPSGSHLAESLMLQKELAR